MLVEFTIEDTKGTAYIGPYSDPLAHMEFSIASPSLIIISHTEARLSASLYCSVSGFCMAVF